MKGHQLYMWSLMREHILERHDFYIDQVKSRVLAHFNDIEDEAEHFAESEYNRLGSQPGDGDTDMSDIAETARDNAHGFYSLLHDLRKQMFLSALAGCFHQFDKELRKFLERELLHTLHKEDAIKYSWNSKFDKIFDLLHQFGWDCRLHSYFLRIDACRLIVNVYKHGKGSSLDQLKKLYPEYLKHPLEDLGPLFDQDTLDHEYLQLSEDQFDELTAAIRTFWVEFPERLYLSCEQN